jgi:hypothetical protein
MSAMLPGSGQPTDGYRAVDGESLVRCRRRGESRPLSQRVQAMCENFVDDEERMQRAAGSDGFLFSK